MDLCTNSIQRPFTCNSCNKGFSHLFILKAHLNTHTREKPLKCKVCNTGFFLRFYYKMHLHLHSAPKPDYYMSNAKCGLKAKKKLNHQKHSAVVFSSNVNKMSKPVSSYSRQKLNVPKNWTANCSEGNKSNSLVPQSIEGHLSTQIAVQKIVCSVCNARFNDELSLKLHFRRHTGKLPFICSECNEGFQQKTSLRKHLRSHVGENPFACCLCWKRFATNEKLKVHLRMHTGEKPFVCTTCDKGFYDKSRLRHHLSLHEKYPFVCSKCHRGYDDKDKFTLHLRSHTADKQFVCSVCKERFYLIRDVRTHMLTHSSIICI